MKIGRAGSITLLFILLILLIGISRPVYASEVERIAEFFEKSFLHEQQGNYAAALNSVLRILQIERENYTATLRAGWLSYLKGAYKESVKYYRKTVYIAPNAIEPKLGLMLPFMALKDWKSSEEIALQVLKSDKKNYYGNSRLAFILFSQKRYGEAEKSYSQVLSLFPSDIEMKLGLGWTYLRMGRKGEAARYFDDVLKTGRHNPSALLGMEEIQNKRK